MRPVDPRLWRLAPGARGPLVVLVLTGLVAGIAAIVQALAVAWLVVAVVRGEHLTGPAAAVVGSFALRGAAAFVTERVATRAGSRVSADLRDRLLGSMLEGPADARSGPGADLALAAQGATSVEPYVVRYLPTLVNAAVLPPSTVLVMAVLDWRTALIPVLTLPLLPLFAALIGSATAEATRTRMATLARLSGHFLDVMRGLPALVTYGRAHRQARVIARVSDDHRTATVATLRIAFLSSAALELLATLSVAIVAVWTGIALAQGRMDLAVALPLIQLAPEAYWPIRRVGAEFHNAADGAQALEDIANHLDRHAVAAGARSGPFVESGPVELHDVSYRYNADGPEVLSGLSVTFERGLTVVTGRSGAGKTTLLEVTAGLRTPTTGRVVRPRAHVVTQRPFLVAGTLRDNLMLGARPGTDDAALTAALAHCGVGDVREWTPQGLDTVVGDDGFGLSAGQLARVAVARALLSDAPLVCLDEPTAHLDAATQDAVHAAISRLASDRIVVAVTHREGLAALADARLDLTAHPDGGTVDPVVRGVTR